MGTNIDNRFLNGINGDFQKPKIVRYNNLKTKIGQINNDISFIQNFVYSLIEAYHKDEIYNEAQRYTFLCNKIKQFVEQKFENDKKTSEESNNNEISKFKSKILKFIIQVKDIKAYDKTKIQQAICDTIIVNDEYIENKITDIIKTRLQTEINDKQKISFIQNVLSNPELINEINNKLSLSVFDISPSKMRDDTNYIKGLIRDFKKYNMNIFPTNSHTSIANSLSFTKLLKKGGNYEIVLLKYNRLVIRKLISKIHEKGVKDWKTIQHNTFLSKLRHDINNEVAYWWKKRRKFKRLITLTFWKKKFHNIVLSFRDTIKKIGISGFLFGGLTLTSKFISLIGRSTIGVIKRGLSLVWTSLKFVKSLVLLSINVVKSVIYGGIGIFKKISLFLLSPPGAYITGFIIGFLKEKIISFFSSMINVIKGLWKWFKEKVKTSDTYKKWKEWKKNKDEGEIDDFSIFDIIKYVEEKILTIIDNSVEKVGEYAKIVREGRGIYDIIDKLKEQLQKDTGYGDIIQDLQLNIPKILDRWGMEKIYKNYNAIIDFIDKMSVTGGIINKLTSFLSMKVGKMRVIKSAITGAAFTTANVIIGNIAALGGPYGWLIGAGLITLNSIIKNLVLSYMSDIPLSKTDTIELENDLDEIDNDFKDDFLVKNKKETESELKSIEERIKNGTSANLEEDEKRKTSLKNKLSVIDEQIRYRKQVNDGDQMEKHLKDIDYKILGGADSETILNYILDGKRENWEKFKPINSLLPEYFPENIKTQIKNIFDIKKTDVQGKLKELIRNYKYDMLSKNEFIQQFNAWYNEYNSYQIVKGFMSNKDIITLGMITNTKNPDFTTLEKFLNYNLKFGHGYYVISNEWGPDSPKQGNPYKIKFEDDFNEYRKSKGYLNSEKELEDETTEIFNELLTRRHSIGLGVKSKDYDKYYTALISNENLIRGYIKRGLIENKIYYDNKVRTRVFVNGKILPIVKQYIDSFHLQEFKGTATDYTKEYKSAMPNFGLWFNPLLPESMQKQTLKFVELMESGTIDDKQHEQLMNCFTDMNAEYRKYNYAAKLTTKINEIFANTEGYGQLINISGYKPEEFNVSSGRE